MTEPKKLLHERLRKCDTSQGGSCSLIIHLLGLSCDDHDHCKDCVNVMINTLADEIERYYTPRPRFEDGEPVQFDDEYVCKDGTIQKVISIGNGRSGSIYINPDSVYEVRLNENEFAKRPQHKVLDAEGVEIKVGDTLWSEDGEKFIVADIDNSYSLPVKLMQDGVFICWNPGKHLTHKEPDSLEKLRDDIQEWDKDHGVNEVECWIARLSALIERGA